MQYKKIDWRSAGILLYRSIISFFLFYGHGWKKLLKFDEIAPKFPDPLGIGTTASMLMATISETAIAAMIIIGLFTRFAAAQLVLLFLVIILIVHAGDSFRDLEKALMYLVAYVSLMVSGAGRYSIDGLLVQRFENNGKGNGIIARLLK
ncbi:DoxX family protein [bacterium]|nr:DoxX family protein [bacterium]